jgi:hypothetical protein
MKKLLLICVSSVLICGLNAFGTITKVFNSVAVNGSTNTGSFSAKVGIIPSQNILLDTTGAQTNYLGVGLDGTNFVNVATNIVTAAGTTNLQPSIPAVAVYYRLSIVTTNNTTNTVYFGN